MRDYQENFAEATEEEMEMIMAEADLMAAADEASRPSEPEDGEDTPMDETEAVKEAEKKRFQVQLMKEYDWGGKKISSIDLSGLVDLTAVDGEFFDRVLVKLGHAPANKFKDTTYTKHVAVRVTGLPLEFFNQLQIRDMMLITGRIYSYFLAG